MRKPTVCACALIAGAMTPAVQAQPFANARASAAGYIGGDVRPAGACEQLHTAGIPDVVEIAGRSVQAEGAVPQHCHVSGVLAPEIAFEVLLPTPWNGRLYMIGNGGHAHYS